ncbi:MAG: DUF2961 domain-containing protein [Cytophagales bacterium]|nr:DUF2961 domain-containing protein [Cytophagales bacterium]
MARNKCNLLFLSVLLFWGCQREPSKVTMDTLLEEMLDRQAVTYYPESDFQTKQFGSYDRRSIGNEETHFWFANDDRSKFLRKEEREGRTEFVMFDHKGPGAVVRFWTTGDQRLKHYTLRFYIDGGDKPAIEGKVIDVVGNGLLAAEPLSVGLSKTTTVDYRRGQNLYLPIPYGKSCKITVSNDKGGNVPFYYYNINYRAYPAGTVVESFSQESLEKAKWQISKTNQALMQGGMLKDAKVREQQEFQETIAPESELHLAFNTPGAVSKLRVQLEADNIPQALRSTVVKMEFDGKQTVWCPLGDFFGIGYAQVANQTHYQQVRDASFMSCQWVMPFNKNCVVTFENLDKQPVKLTGDVEVQDYEWKENSMHFYTSWLQHSSIVTGQFEGQSGKSGHQDLNFVKLKGQGVLVGDALTIFNTAHNGNRTVWWGEGDEKIYIDGESQPSHFGTGTEDYYGYAWGRGEAFMHPFVSQPIGEGNRHAGLTVNSRFRALDRIPFKRSLRFDMELWHWIRTKVDYAPVVYSYMKPGGESSGHPNPFQAKEKVALNRYDIMVPVPDKNGKLEGDCILYNKKTTLVRAENNPKYSGSNLTKFTAHQHNQPIEVAFEMKESKAADLDFVVFGTKDCPSLDLYLNGELVKKGAVVPGKSGQSRTVTVKHAKLLEGKNNLVFKVQRKCCKTPYVGLDYITVKEHAVSSGAEQIVRR